VPGGHWAGGSRSLPAEEKLTGSSHDDDTEATSEEDCLPGSVKLGLRKFTARLLSRARSLMEGSFRGMGPFGHRPRQAAEISVVVRKIFVNDGHDVVIQGVVAYACISAPPLACFRSDL
jgi:hypothetical protein